MASRRVATTLVGSYPTVSPLPAAPPELRRPAVSFLFHFPSAFAAWGFPSALPFGVRTFLGPTDRPAATRPARSIVDVFGRRSGRQIPSDQRELVGPRLAAALEQCLDLLRPHGRLCVISYHSLEDRIVKRFIARERRGCVCPPDLPVCACGREPRLAPVGPQPQVPTSDEIARNPRSRSARLRAARRIAA